MNYPVQKGCGGAKDLAFNNKFPNAAYLQTKLQVAKLQGLPWWLRW